MTNFMAATFAVLILGSIGSSIRLLQAYREIKSQREHIKSLLAENAALNRKNNRLTDESTAGKRITSGTGRLTWGVLDELNRMRNLG